MTDGEQAGRNGQYSDPLRASRDDQDQRDAAPCAACPGRRVGLCRDVPLKSLVPAIRHRRRLQTVRPGAVILRQGEPSHRIFTVRSGWLCLFKLFGNGRRQVLRFCLPGDLVGFSGAAADLMPFGAEALTDVSLCALDLDDLRELCCWTPQLALRLAELAADDARVAWDRVGALGQLGADGRVAYVLVELLGRLRGRIGAGGRVMPMPVTQVLLADAAGLTPVHVCRTLRRMREQGIVDFRKGCIHVLDPARMAELIQVELPVMPPAARPPPALAAGPWQADGPVNG